MNPPLLLVDVDGVLSLFGFDPAAPPKGRFVSVDGIPHLLSEDAARRLLALAGDYELVWCSGWEEKANEYLPSLLGLPAGLAHLEFPPSGDSGRHWKLEAIDRFAGDQRPLAWVDDAHDDTCRAWASGRPGPTLLIRTRPPTGLTAELADQLAGWARDLREGRVPR